MTVNPPPNKLFQAALECCAGAPENDVKRLLWVESGRLKRVIVFRFMSLIRRRAKFPVSGHHRRT